MNRATEGQKKIAALNLKSLLAIFTVELDNVIKRGDVQQPQPQPQQPAQPNVLQPAEPNVLQPAQPNVLPPVNDPLADFPVVVEPPLPAEPPIQNKPSWDMDMMD